MAKQIGQNPLTGTLGDVTYYVSDGQTLARMKSSLTGKRVKKDPKFAGLMRYSDYMAVGSPLATSVYLLLPKDKRKNSFRLKMTGMAITHLRDGATKAEVLEILKAHAQTTLYVRFNP